MSLLTWKNCDGDASDVVACADDGRGGEYWIVRYPDGSGHFGAECHSSGSPWISGYAETTIEAAKVRAQVRHERRVRARQNEIDPRWDEQRRASLPDHLEVIQKCSNDNQMARVMPMVLAKWDDAWKQQALRDGWSEDDLAAMAEGRGSIAIYVKCWEKSLARLEREIAALIGRWVSNKHPTKQ